MDKGEIPISSNSEEESDDDGKKSKTLIEIYEKFSS